MLDSVVGSFVAVGLNTTDPKYFWRGVSLTQVISLVVHKDDDTSHIKLRVQNTTAFDPQYTEMQAAGVSIQKV